MQSAHDFGDDFHIFIVKNSVKIFSELFTVRKTGEIPQIKNIFNINQVFTIQIPQDLIPNFFRGNKNVSYYVI